MDTNDLSGITATFTRVALALEREGITEESIERLTTWGTVTMGRTLTRDPEANWVPWASVNFHAHIGLDGHMVQGTDGDHLAELLVKAVRAAVETAKSYQYGYERAKLDAAYELGEAWIDGSRSISEGDRDVRLPSVLRTLDAAARYGHLEQARVLALDLRKANMQDWQTQRTGGR